MKKKQKDDIPVKVSPVHHIRPQQMSVPYPIRRVLRCILFWTKKVEGRPARNTCN